MARAQGGSEEWAYHLHDVKIREKILSFITH